MCRYKVCKLKVGDIQMVEKVDFIKEDLIFLFLKKVKLLTGMK